MRLGFVVLDTWSFFTDIAEHLSSQFETSVFSERAYRLPFLGARINRRLLHHDLDTFMARNDVVFFEWASRHLAEATHRPKRCKIVTRLHRYELYGWASKIDWQNVDRIILVSETMKRKFAGRFPEHVSRARVIPNGVPLNRFKPVERSFGSTLGFLGHIIPLKRVYELVLAFGELARQEEDLKLVIGGESTPDVTGYAEAVQSLVAKLQLEDRITFCGYVIDAPEWYHGVDIFVSNSYREGMQVALLEAMASGCYCLAHRWDGAEEVVPQENLFTTERDFVDQVRAFCHMPSFQRTQLERRMRDIAVERFDIERVKTQIASTIVDTWNSQVT